MKKIRIAIMQILMFALLIGLGISYAFANPYEFKILKVSDGDTVVFEAPFMPAPLKPQLSLRVLGVDTPEKGARAGCPAEAAAAEKASAFTKNLVANAQKIQVELKAHDKFGGRVLGDLIVDGQRLSALLIQNGHARAYFGEKKQSWCN
jgi:endonuclease YncB( thermonuclease family)